MGGKETDLRRRLFRLGMAAQIVAGLAVCLLVGSHIVGLLPGVAPAGGSANGLVALAFTLPALAYLYGLWTLGGTFRVLGEGSLFSPALSSGLRRVGLALSAGGLVSLTVMPNLLRLAGHASGAFFNFDTGAMALVLTGGALYLLGAVIDRAARQEALMKEFI